MALKRTFGQTAIPALVKGLGVPIIAIIAFIVFLFGLAFLVKVVVG